MRHLVGMSEFGAATHLVAPVGYRPSERKRHRSPRDPHPRLPETKGGSISGTPKPLRKEGASRHDGDGFGVRPPLSGGGNLEATTGMTGGLLRHSASLALARRPA